MAIGRDEVLHVAKLARLELSEDELERMQEQLSAILDAVGTVVYASLWIVLGAMFGPTVLERSGSYARALVLLVPAALLGVLAYRLVRRRRYGPASHDLVPPR